MTGNAPTMPKVVIAPQEFKGSLTAIEIARAMQAGVLRAVPDAETVLAPVADGGDGTLQALVDSSDGRIESATVTGPLGEAVAAEWGALGDGETAVIEMAQVLRPGVGGPRCPRPPPGNYQRRGRTHSRGPQRRPVEVHNRHRRQRHQ